MRSGFPTNIVIFPDFEVDKGDGSTSPPLPSEAIRKESLSSKYEGEAVKEETKTMLDMER